MKFNILALSLACGIVWGLTILLVASANLIWPAYGRVLLDLLASVYPGYHPGSGASSVLVGTLYGLVDGAIGGALFAWIYNLVADRR